MVIKILLALMFLLCGVFLLCKSTEKYRKNKAIKLGSQEKAKGLIFGKNNLNQVVYSPTNDEGHCFTLGGSGTGKTVWLINTLRNWSGTSFVVDISGDISSNVACDKKLVYNPLENHSTAYNIFGAIDKQKTRADQDQALEQLAFQLMPEQPNMSDSGRFFLTEGRKILTASLIAFYHQGADFVAICDRLIASSWLVVFNQIRATKDEKAIKYISSFDGANEQNTAGCFQACIGAIHLFGTNETVAQTIRRPAENEIAITPETLNEYNVYVLIPDEKLETLAPLLHIITAQMLEFLSARNNNESNTILLCLDEFASLGKLEILPALRKLRKKKVRIVVLTQSLADLDLMYSKNERIAMLNNFKYKVVMSASDVDTQEYFSKLAGTHQSRKETVNKNGSYGATNSTSITYIDEPNIKPQEFAKLNNRLVLLCNGDYFKLKKIFYYKKKRGITK